MAQATAGQQKHKMGLEQTTWGPEVKYFKQMMGTHQKDIEAKMKGIFEPNLNKLNDESNRL